MEWPTDLEARRPVVLPVDGLVRRAGAPVPPVLTVGIVLGDQPHTAVDTEQRLGEARHYEVHQRWVVVDGDGGLRPRPASVVVTTSRRRPKFEVLDEQLQAVDLDAYEYVMLVDDDVIVPFGFVDAFLDLQTALRFAIAQPARTAGSGIDHPIVARHPGLVARQTWFVEQGPIVSFHRSILDAVVPFDLRSPMGWGVEGAWSALVERRGLQMGVIDAVSIDHSVRPVLTNYSLAEASRGADALLAAVAHRPLDDCMRVVRAIRTLP